MGIIIQATTIKIISHSIQNVVFSESFFEDNFRWNYDKYQKLQTHNLGLERHTF